MPAPEDYQVAVPSYQRPELCASATLPLLAERGVDRERITVFVADEHEARTYRRALNPHHYGEIVVAEPGMRAVRNFINRHYPDGTLLVQADDDLREVYRKHHGNQRQPLPDLHELFTMMFRRMTAARLSLWGIYPVDNPFFMKHRIEVGLHYIVGALWGVHNRHAPHCQVSLDDKEDFERSLRHFEASGAVMRIADVGIVTRYYTQPGGMQVTRSEDRVTASAVELHHRYPTLTRLKRRKSGHMEVELLNPARQLAGGRHA